jgi:hypothetical protein
MRYLAVHAPKVAYARFDTEGETLPAAAGCRYCAITSSGLPWARNSPPSIHTARSHNTALTRLDNSRHQAQQCRFTGPVTANNPQRIALHHAQRYPIQHMVQAVVKAVFASKVMVGHIYQLQHRLPTHEVITRRAINRLCRCNRANPANTNTKAPTPISARCGALGGAPCNSICR